MLFDEEIDWKEFLSTEEQVELAELIEKTKKYKGAYMQAEDVKVAQMWCALIKMSKRLRKTQERLEKLESTMKALAEIGNIAKRDALQEKVRDVLKVQDSKEKKIADRIVDSLMEL